MNIPRRLSTPPMMHDARRDHIRRKLARAAALLLPTLLALSSGCGTTKWTDTRRSGTEQMLLSDAMDRAVSRLDLTVMAGKGVCLRTEALKEVVDSPYLVSSLRQHMLASGLILKEKEEDAQYILEVRAGAVGTDRDDLFYGIPAINIPTTIPLPGSFAGSVPQTPEIPFIKKTRQRAVAKIAMFAYNRETGRPVWQSGIKPIESDAKAWWVFGAGPFQRGEIYDGMQFFGETINVPQLALGQTSDPQSRKLSVFDEAVFPESPETVRLAQREAEAEPTPEPDQAPPPSRPETRPPAVPNASGPPSIPGPGAPKPTRRIFPMEGDSLQQPRSVEPFAPWRRDPPPTPPAYPTAVDAASAETPYENAEPIAPAVYSPPEYAPPVVAEETPPASPTENAPAETPPPSAFEAWPPPRPDWLSE